MNEREHQGDVSNAAVPSAWPSIVLGAVYAILGAYPAAAFTTLVYRFPVPFAGFVSGPNGVSKALGAVLFWEVVGGALLLGVLGAILGIVVHALSRSWSNQLHVQITLIVAALVVDLLVTFVLAQHTF